MIGVLAIIGGAMGLVPAAGNIVINEIMYAPTAGEPEWIELRNNTGIQIDLNGWSISDASVSARHVISHEALTIPPQGFVVLTKDSAALSRFRPSIPGRVISIPLFPSLNNTGDAISLFDANGRVQDSVTYDPSWGGGSGGYSLERIDPKKASQDPAGWSSSLDSTHATAGRENSVAIRDYDVRPGGVSLIGMGNGSFQLNIVVSNSGRMSATNVTVDLWDDVDGSGTGEMGEKLLAVPIEGVILPYDSARISWDWISPGAGIHAIIVSASFQQDQRPTDNILESQVTIPGTTGSIVLNEIMFAPLSGEPEYVELANPGTAPVNVALWRINDRPGAKGAPNVTVLPDGAHFIPAGSYAVAVADSGVFQWFPETGQLDASLILVPVKGLVSLNNDGDDVILRDTEGTLIDSVSYDPAWHSPSVFDRTGRSLERRLFDGLSNDPSNWTSCVLPEGGTPGRRNSAAIEALKTGGSLTCHPSPFSPDGDGHDDATVVRYQLPLGDWSVQAKVFDSRGRLVRHLLTDVPAGAEGECVWDGRDDRHSRVRMGIYVIFLQAIDTGTGRNIVEKNVVVVAGALR
jgi:hypothetical protein